MNKDHYYESRRNRYAYYISLCKSSGKFREMSEDIADFMLT